MRVNIYTHGASSNPTDAADGRRETNPDQAKGGVKSAFACLAC